jgi:hypothetical protein
MSESPPQYGKKAKEKAKWKDRLLSSGVPLEHEVAALLVEHGFSTRSDFPYLRLSEGAEKEFTVDLEATTFAPFDKNDNLRMHVRLLIECKYRADQTEWLIFEDPNEGESSQGLAGATLRVIDEFCYWFANEDPVIAFDGNMPFAHKAVEVRLGAGEVYDAEIKRGAEQLRYGMPSLLADEFGRALRDRREDSMALAVCPILVTNAPLLLAKRALTIEQVRRASKLSDIATPVNSAVLILSSGEEFRRHSGRAFATLHQQHLNTKGLGELNEYRTTGKEYNFRLPIPLLQGLAKGETPYGPHQVLLCTFAALPKLIREIKRVLTEVVDSLDTERKIDI